MSNPSGLVLEDKTTRTGKATVGASRLVTDAAVVWLDAAAKAEKLTLSQDVGYHVASSTGTFNTVKATLVDQYGDPVSRHNRRNLRVEFFSDDKAGIGVASTGAPAALTFNTASSGTRLFEDADAKLTRPLVRGVASLSYNRKSSDSGIETILAEVKVGDDDPIKAEERVYHYWANELADDGEAAGRLLVTNTDDNEMVIAGAGGVLLVKYDPNDHFATSDGAATLSGFETDLKDNAKHASVKDYQTASKNVSRFTTGHAWASLDHPGGQAAIEADSRFGQAFAVDNGVIVVGASHEAIDHDDDDNPSTPTVSLSLAGMVYVYPGGITDADSRGRTEVAQPYGERPFRV